MAQRRAFTEGFDLYPGITTSGYGVLSSWLANGSTGNVNLVAGRFGGLALGPYGSDVTFRRAVPETTQAVFGIAYYPPALFSTNAYAAGFWDASGNLHFSVRCDAFGRLEVWSGSTKLAVTTDPVLTGAAWNYIEVAVNLSDTTGSVRVWLNDFAVEELSLDNVDTKGAAGATIASAGFRQTGGSHLYDDCYCEIDGLTRVGEGRIFQLKPTTDVENDFTPSTAVSNYQSVNQVPASATLYNASGTVDDQDLFTVEGMSFAPEKIYGVQVTTLSSKDEAATRAIKRLLKSGSVLSESADFPLTFGSSIFSRDWYPQDPNTLAAWLKAGVENAQIGYKVSV